MSSTVTVWRDNRFTNESYRVNKLAVPQTPLPQQAGTAQAIFKFIVRCITYRGTNSLLLKTIASSSSTASYFIIAEILRTLGTVVSTHVALLREGRRKWIIFQLYPLYHLKAFLSKNSWLLRVRDKGTRTQLYMMSHMYRILPYLLVAMLSTDIAGREDNLDLLVTMFSTNCENNLDPPKVDLYI